MLRIDFRGRGLSTYSGTVEEELTIENVMPVLRLVEREAMAGRW